jgi:hypothetical protein
MFLWVVATRVARALAKHWGSETIVRPNKWTRERTAACGNCERRCRRLENMAGRLLCTFVFMAQPRWSDNGPRLAFFIGRKTHCPPSDGWVSAHGRYRDKSRAPVRASGRLTGVRRVWRGVVAMSTVMALDTVKLNREARRLVPRNVVARLCTQIELPAMSCQLKRLRSL